MSIAILNNMFRDYTPFQAMKDDVKRSDFLLSNISKMNMVSKFREGKFQIPMVTAQHSNVRNGKLTAIADITKGEHAKPYVEEADLAKFWGSITFTESEIRDFGSTKDAYINLMPDKVNELMENFKELIAIRYLLDGSICSVVAGGTPASGIVKVTRVERLNMKQRLDFYDGVTVVVGYVRAIDMNAETIEVYDAEVGGSAIDLSAAGVMTDETDVKLYIHDDANKAKSTLKSMLLPASEGGDAELHHVNKLAAGPIWQSQYFDMSGFSFSASNALENFFSQIVSPIKQKGKIKEPNIALPYAAFNALMLKAQSSKRYASSEIEVHVGFDKITMTGAGGRVHLMGVYDLVGEGFVLDWDKLMFVAPEFFTTGREKGQESWTHVRPDDGEDHVYVLDILFKGTLAIKGKASGFAVLDNITV
jgi:hypothetical protein